MKKLYYTVEKELVGNDPNTGIEETTGNKTITCYSIVNNEIKEQFSIDTQNEYNSESEIQEYLDNNGMGDEEFELIIL